ncbi:glycerophosphodiester phosphodiesterase [Haliea sp. E17]|uniref:glycerophosphodiester phosphodiesterase n=1 Tax=Haliea sp. E17 TaxID=3401576 RepID=UPI003AB06ED8
MTETLQDLVMAMADTWMAAIPRSVPDKTALQRCRLVSHRGEHDGKLVRENTLQAFADASAAGVWGIECDIRWSADGQPVICHDPDLQRVFGAQQRVAECTLAQLGGIAPDLPTLQALVAQFGGRNHLMLELKADSRGATLARRQSLQQLLSPLEPGRDFHILALDPALFELVSFLPPSACLPVAQTNTRKLSEVALQRGYAGLAGHYLLLGTDLQHRHQAVGQRVGSGFPTSSNCLWREINRGMDWIFSNHAVALQRAIAALLEDQNRNTPNRAA